MAQQTPEQSPVPPLALIRTSPGALSEGVKVDDSMWAIEGGTVELNLVKVDGMHWWSRVLATDEPIDVQK
eukprot:342047-Chlamydomonas_euryale.AAC.1